MGNFCPPGFGSGFRIRIRIHRPDWIRFQNPGFLGCGSGFFEAGMLDPDWLEQGIGDSDASVVDPDPVGSESLWNGQIRIRFNFLRSGSGVKIRIRGWVRPFWQICLALYAFLNLKAGKFVFGYLVQFSLEIIIVPLVSLCSTCQREKV